jgi:hypothetical protein
MQCSLPGLLGDPQPEEETIQTLTRNFYWKCIHDIFRVENFWGHIEKPQILELCPVCKVRVHGAYSS